MPIEATFRSSDPYTVTGERANGAIVWSNGIIWKDGPADGALCGQWTQYHNGQIYTVVQIGSSEIQWVSGANETHFPASITAPPVPPCSQGCSSIMKVVIVGDGAIGKVCTPSVCDSKCEL